MFIVVGDQSRTLADATAVGLHTGSIERVRSCGANDAVVRRCPRTSLTFGGAGLASSAVAETTVRASRATGRLLLSRIALGSVIGILCEAGLAGYAIT